MVNRSCVGKETKQMIYFKSLVENNGILETKTYNPKTKGNLTCQTLNEILHSKILKPNTVHAKLKKRLSVSHIHSGYTGQYRSEGLIFITTKQPNYCIPFDLLALANISAEKFTSNYYDTNFLDGYNKYLFDTVDAMLKRYPNANIVLHELTKFRKKYNLNGVQTETMQYNECCFENDIAITPIAMIGTSPSSKKYAKENSLSIYSSIKEYIKENNKN